MAAKKKTSLIQSLGSFLGNIVKPIQQQNTPKNIWNTISQKAQQVLPQIGYKLGLPGFGITEPAGTPFQKERTPEAVKKGIVPQNFISPIRTQDIVDTEKKRQEEIKRVIEGTRQIEEQRQRDTGGTTDGGQINYNTPPPTGTTPISGEVKTEAQTYLDNAVKTISDLLSSSNLNLGDPFALDELLANNAATQAISPYYAQIYGRFKKAMDLDKQMGQGKTQRGLQELGQGTDTYQTKLARLLQLGQQSTGEQFAGQGLYESGGRQRAQGLQNVTASQDLSNFLSGQQRNEQGLRQAQEDMLNRLLLQKQEKESELAGAQRMDIESSVQEAQRVAQARQGIAALEGQPLTNQNIPEYFQKRGETLSRFLPSNY